MMVELDCCRPACGFVTYYTKKGDKLVTRKEFYPIFTDGVCTHYLAVMSIVENPVPVPLLVVQNSKANGVVSATQRSNSSSSHTSSSSHGHTTSSVDTNSSNDNATRSDSDRSSKSPSASSSTSLRESEAMEKDEMNVEGDKQ